MGLFNKVFKTIKKAALPVLGGAAAYFGAPYAASAFQSAFPGDPVELGTGDGGVNRGSDGIQTLGRVAAQIPIDVNPLIAGAASLVGGQATNTANARQAQQQMDFQAAQTATAHQREVADLRAAGLNPILSAGGNGAHSGMGASASIQDVVGPAVSSALEVRRAEDEHRNSKSTNALLKAQSAKTAVEANATAAQIPQSIQLARKYMADAGISEAELEAILADRGNAAEVSRGVLGKPLRYIKAITDAFGFHSGASVSGSVSSHRRGPKP
ncbi:MAG: DNA pilot protein [Microviridae sp.]|nr:MAG: DNA pilot protein [Microviridae sp.]